MGASCECKSLKCVIDLLVKNNTNNIQ